MPWCLLLPQVYAGTLHGALPVAIKVMDPAWLRVRPETFWREAMVLQQCRHPSIVELLGLYNGGAVQKQEEEGEPQQPEEEQPEQPRVEEPEDDELLEKLPDGMMVVMELMPGGPLLDRLADPDMRWYRRCAPLAMGICVATATVLLATHPPPLALQLTPSARLARSALSHLHRACQLPSTVGTYALYALCWLPSMQRGSHRAGHCQRPGLLARRAAGGAL